MMIGYARVSTNDQNLDLQRDALEAAGCEKVFIDEGISGAKTERPGLGQALAYARQGDTVVVWRLDRLGRSVSHLIQEVNALGERGVEFKSLQESIDTTSATGKLIFHVMAAMAEFERDLIRERTNAGLAAAKARGRMGGRKAALSPAQVAAARAMAADPNLTVGQAIATLGCSRSTYFRAVRGA
jgi:DNA invertase Pin-like site-specific DNA recombinase